MITRFAPSPTGLLHLGGLRTALFNYLLCQKYKSKDEKAEFLLRIEDTDRQRTVNGAVADFMDHLRWAGIHWNKGPDTHPQDMIQSNRLVIYRRYAMKLIDLDLAYSCDCPPSQSSQQDSICQCWKRKKNIISSSTTAIRFKRIQSHNFQDLVFGNIPRQADGYFHHHPPQEKENKDPIIIKSDGFPTYHFANVIDDHLMNVTLVMRGAEWLPSTSLHLDLYQALGWIPPTFAHLPLLCNPDGSKLSKRQGHVHVRHFRQNGYVPMALVNFVALLGWHPKTNQELYPNMDELIAQFDINHLQRSEACVDLNKLNWFNRQHIKHNRISAAQYLAELVNEDVNYCTQVLSVLDGRFDKLTDIPNRYGYFFNHLRINNEGDCPQPGRMIQELFQQELDSPVVIRTVLKNHTADDLKHLRLWLTGQPVGPPLSDIIACLGRERMIRRLRFDPLDPSCPESRRN